MKKSQLFDPLMMSESVRNALNAMSRNDISTLADPLMMSESGRKCSKRYESE